MCSRAHAVRDVVLKYAVIGAVGGARRLSDCSKQPRSTVTASGWLSGSSTISSRAWASPSGASPLVPRRPEIGWRRAILSEPRRRETINAQGESICSRRRRYFETNELSQPKAAGVPVVRQYSRALLKPTRRHVRRSPSKAIVALRERSERHRRQVHNCRLAVQRSRELMT
jgi:hypothetical protein